MFNRLRNIGFTKQDIIIISFLLISFTAGLIIKFSGWKPVPEFDYTSADRQFEQSIKNSFSELEGVSSVQSEKLKKLNNIKDSISGSRKDIKLSSKETALNKKININTASQEELMLLPGIGRSIAERIVAYRELHKGFSSAGELMEVKGIGEKKFEKIRNFVLTDR
jgi:comEA protein